MKKEVGRVTESERDEIQALYERRNGLNELAKIVSPDNDAMYEKLVADLGATVARFQEWWSRMSAEYEWENVPGANWEIDFESCKIFLVD